MQKATWWCRCPPPASASRGRPGPRPPSRSRRRPRAPSRPSQRRAAGLSRPSPPASSAAEGPGLLPGEGRCSEGALAAARTARPGRRCLKGRGGPRGSPGRGGERPGRGAPAPPQRADGGGRSPAGPLRLLGGAARGLPATHLLLLGRGGLGTLGRHGAAAAGRRGEGRRGRRDRRSSAQRSAATTSRTRWRPLTGRSAGGTRLPPRSARPAARPRFQRRSGVASAPAPDAAGHAGRRSPAGGGSRPEKRPRPAPPGSTAPRPQPQPFVAACRHRQAGVELQRAAWV